MGGVEQNGITVAKRKSKLTGVQLDVPEPSKKELKRWAHLVEECKKAILANAPQHNWSKKNKVGVRFSEAFPKPEGFPKHNLTKGEFNLYNAEIILLWLWERKLADKNPSMLYKERHKYLYGITRVLHEYDNIINNYVDSLQDSAYNGVTR